MNELLIYGQAFLVIVALIGSAALSMVALHWAVELVKAKIK